MSAKNLEDLSEEEEVDEAEMRREELIRYIVEKDVFLFNGNKKDKGEYFIVKSVGPKTVYATGEFIDLDRRVYEKRISIKKLAETDPKVAHFRDILLFRK